MLERLIARAKTFAANDIICREYMGQPSPPVSYLDIMAERSALLKAIAECQADLASVKPATRVELVEIKRDRERLKALQSFVEDVCHRGTEGALSRVHYDLLPELRDVYQAPDAALIREWEEAIDRANSLGTKKRLQAALLASQGHSNACIEKELKDSNGSRLVRDGRKRGKNIGLPNLPVHPTRS